ncbi:hypothetical protein F66182_484 [Fusarium sp. NRRL 66182]|nr:hypothetical protein F66182_484 [Fusarium sp. NRRL 66182]
MGSSFSTESGDPYWWGYLDDGKGWTARPKAEYMADPSYNKDLRRQLRQQKREQKQKQKQNRAKPGSGYYGS